MKRDELRAALLEISQKKEDIVVRPVPTPEWSKLDGQIHVRSFSVVGREKYLDSVRTIRPRDGEMPEVKVFLEGAQSKLAAHTMCDEDGELLFTEDDIPALNELSATAMERVINVSGELNELDEKSARERVARAKNALAPAVVA
jgi:hypothetical protein